MKINRFLALALIALLVVGAMGLISYQALAQRNAAQTAQDCNSEVEDGDAGEAAETEDADEAEEECGDQSEDEDNEVNEAAEANGQDSSDETAPASTGITAAEAQAIVEAANPGASTLAVEFDREGGKDLWEVELDNGQDVKVDASTGEILYSEARD
jgi:uncharacterized membrane protein YkoI